MLLFKQKWEQYHQKSGIKTNIKSVPLNFIPFNPIFPLDLVPWYSIAQQNIKYCSVSIMLLFKQKWEQYHQNSGIKTNIKSDPLNFIPFNPIFP